MRAHEFVELERLEATTPHLARLKASIGWSGAMEMEGGEPAIVVLSLDGIAVEDGIACWDGDQHHRQFEKCS